MARPYNSACRLSQHMGSFSRPHPPSPRAQYVRRWLSFPGTRGLFSYHLSRLGLNLGHTRKLFAGSDYVLEWTRFASSRDYTRPKAYTRFFSPCIRGDFVPWRGAPLGIRAPSHTYHLPAIFALSATTYIVPSTLHRLSAPLPPTHTLVTYLAGHRRPRRRREMTRKGQVHPHGGNNMSSEVYRIYDDISENIHAA